MTKNRKDKDRLRKLKRVVKRSGNKKVRSSIKKDLATNPEDTHLNQVDYGGSRSEELNGMDYDSTRKKKTRHEEVHSITEEQSGTETPPTEDDTVYFHNKLFTALEFPTEGDKT